MRKRIVVAHGEGKRIAELMGCTKVMVSYSLAYKKNSELAAKIRKMALMRGGVEIGNEPAKEESYENSRAV